MNSGRYQVWLMHMFVAFNKGWSNNCATDSLAKQFHTCQTCSIVRFASDHIALYVGQTLRASRQTSYSNDANTRSYGPQENTINTWEKHRHSRKCGDYSARAVNLLALHCHPYSLDNCIHQYATSFPHSIIGTWMIKTQSNQINVATVPWHIQKSYCKHPHGYESHLERHGFAQLGSPYHQFAKWECKCRRLWGYKQNAHGLHEISTTKTE